MLATHNPHGMSLTYQQITHFTNRAKLAGEPMVITGNLLTGPTTTPLSEYRNGWKSCVAMVKENGEVWYNTGSEMKLSN